jgi:DNA repair protein RecN (Recombination protein N)
MLTTLRIKNLALVSDLTLELQPGYNVITGETGAGKSVILGALNLVLGQRADRSLIRSGADSCSVEAVFDVTKLRLPLKSFLDENGLEPCEDGQLVLKRTFTNAGTNRQFVNGSATTLNVLAELGEGLLDMHGPHDHQSLLHSAKQLNILDAFGGLEAERNAFGDLVRQRNELESEKAALVVDEKTYAQQLDLLRFQVHEIETARLQPDEEEQLTQEHHRVSNAARLLQLSQAALDVLSESETAVLTQAGAVGRLLQELQRVDAGAASLTELQEQAAGTLRELQTELSRYADKVDVDPARLAELDERLNLIHSLKRKYGATLAEVLALSAPRPEPNCNHWNPGMPNWRESTAPSPSSPGNCSRPAKSFRPARQKVIPKLTKAVAKQLADLGFKQSQFEVALTFAIPPEFTPHVSRLTTGFDEIEFQFSPNVGEPLKPLRAIASSGEMARVMLALKTVLAAEDEIPVLVFDEVDANVGGETANAVGEKMKQIAAKRQVFCITHLPQVAAVADAHYVVSKQVKDGRTISEISLLDGKSRVTELARMLGGQTEAARKHAAALLR